MPTLRPTVSVGTLSPQGDLDPPRQVQESPNRRDGAPPNGNWGDPLIKTKPEGCFRIAFQNIGGLPLACESLPSEKITYIFQSYQFDYFGVQEVNLHDRILPPSLRWTRRFPGIHSKLGTNQHSSSTRRRLFGGTAHFLSKSATLSQIAAGCDPSGLGRWTWTLLQGRRGLRVRLISSYRPVLDTSDRAFSVYSQHEAFFNSLAADSAITAYRCPRLALFEDLDAEISPYTGHGCKWRHSSGGDCGVDVQVGPH